MPTVRHPGDTKRVLAGPLSADTRHLGVSQAAQELGLFRLTVSNLELVKFEKSTVDIQCLRVIQAFK